MGGGGREEGEMAVARVKVVCGQMLKCIGVLMLFQIHMPEGLSLSPSLPLCCPADFDLNPCQLILFHRLKRLPGLFISFVWPGAT